MAKKKIKHQSFKLTPHGHPREKVLLYIVIVLLISVFLGYLLKDNFSQVLGVATY